MDARAVIAMMHDEDSLTSVRLYRNTEEEQAGAILIKQYPSPQKVENLIRGGVLLELGDTPESSLYCKDDTERWGRIVPERHKSLADLFSRYMGQVDYIYIYGRNHKWYCHNCKQ